MERLTLLMIIGLSARFCLFVPFNTELDVEGVEL